MCLNDTIHTKIELAKSKNSKKLWKSLINDTNLDVRVAVAKNTTVPSEIINLLLYDPTANVSYIASMNPNCTEIRDFTDKEYLTALFKSA